MIRGILQNKKGSALPLVIILIPVLVILGVTLLNISLFEVKQTVYQEKKLQAHYLAWSGADATASWIVQNSTTDGLLNTTSDWTELPNVDKGRFRVNITGTADYIRILSTGEVDGVTQTVTLLLTNVGDIPPTPIDDVVEASGTLDWLSGNSNIIKNKTDVSQYPVRFFPTNSNNKQATLTPNDNVDFTAPAIYFDTGLLIRKSNNGTTELILRTETLVFRNEVIIEDGGYLTLFAPNGQNGTTIIDAIQGRKYGKVYFVNEVRFDNNVVIEPGAYYFPDGFTLPGDQLKSPANGGLIPLNGHTKTWK